MHRILLALLFTAHGLLAGVDDEWRAIQEMDQGPSGEFRSAGEVASAAKNHLVRQEDALRQFIDKYPGDGRLHQALIRLSGVLVASGAMNPGALRDLEAIALLDQVEKAPAALAKDKADAGFARVSMTMQRTPPVAERERLLLQVREFAAKYPSDPRIGSLLAEVATVFDLDPPKKRALLNEALLLNPAPEIKARIADDMKRLDMVGLPMRLRANGVNGTVVDVETIRGKPVIVFFWAGWSQPSIKQLERLIELESQVPRKSFEVIAISLDKNRKQVAQAWKQTGVTWPLICDEKGWESPLVRSVGINVLPTTWILDREGVLRVLNAREDVADRLRELIAQ